MPKKQASLLIGTIKGGFVLDAGPGRRSWKIRGPFQFGQVVNDFRLDPRDGRTLLLSATGGHLGPTIYRSTNRGRTWTEAKRPPKYGKGRKAARGEQKDTRGLAVESCFWLGPGHVDEPGVWYVGTAPSGMFRSTDGGLSWRPVKGWNEGKSWGKWNLGGNNVTPGGAIQHSIEIDPRDRKHMYTSLSVGGTFESFDQGKSWAPLNRGVAKIFPGGSPDYGHDPHCMIIHPADPDVLYQQNHCGFYRMQRDATEEWARVGRKMPKKIGDIGFPVVGHPTDADTVWTFPMDGTQKWPRTSVDGKPAVYKTENGGRSWQRKDKGLPRKNGWYTVLRQAMCADDDQRRTGVYFGTTGGDVWASRDGADSWNRIAEGLPRVFSVRHAVFR